MPAAITSYEHLQVWLGSLQNNIRAYQRLFMDIGRCFMENKIEI